VTDESLETLRRQLAELDSLIESEQEAIRVVKGNLTVNQAKIDTLLKRTEK
jgi:hypothetical protein